MKWRWTNFCQSTKHVTVTSARRKIPRELVYQRNPSWSKSRNCDAADIRYLFVNEIYPVLFSRNKTNFNDKKKIRRRCRCHPAKSYEKVRRWRRRLANFLVTELRYRRDEKSCAICHRYEHISLNRRDDATSQRDTREKCWYTAVWFYWLHDNSCVLGTRTALIRYRCIFDIPIRSYQRYRWK